LPLPKLTADKEWIGAGRLRAADDGKSLLSYHPIVIDQTVLVRTDTEGNSYLTALDLKTGRRLWQVDYSRAITRPADDESAVKRQQQLTSDVHADFPRHIGVARYTLTASGNKLFARMGSPITAPASRRAALWLAKDQGFLLGLNLAAQGKPLEGFPIRPPSNEWTFEGTPLCDGGSIYVVMRRVEGTRSQLYLTAFELPTTPQTQQTGRDDPERPVGRVKWRTKICSSASLGGGDIDQLSHLLVTRSGNRLYVNTSAGAVAAISADDGRLLWLVKYPRATFNPTNSDLPQQHWFRDLAPGLAWKDLVIVAPADSDRIFALHAITGQLAWTLAPGEADDAVHLLGVHNDALLVSGDYLYWIDANTGRLLTQFPQGRLGGAEQAAPSPRGIGRGLIAGDNVWWPTRESIFVFQMRPAETDFGWQPRLVREIPLLPRGATGGNLVLAEGVLLIASGDRLVALGE
jgi:outer membrane protein assembly factor BamB